MFSFRRRDSERRREKNEKKDDTCDDLKNDQLGVSVSSHGNSKFRISASLREDSGEFRRRQSKNRISKWTVRKTREWERETLNRIDYFTRKKENEEEDVFGEYQKLFVCCPLLSFWNQLPHREEEDVFRWGQKTAGGGRNGGWRVVDAFLFLPK